MPTPRRTLALALAAALGIGAAGCGSADDGLLSASQANDLRSSINFASSSVRDGRCTDARDAADSAGQKVRDLPDSVDTDLQRNLAEGFSHLTDQINAECTAEEEATPTPEPTETPTPEATETVTPEATETVTPEPTETVTPVPTDTVDPGTGGTSPEETPDPDAPQRGLGDDGT